VEVAIMLKALVFPAAALAVASCGAPDRPLPTDSVAISQSTLQPTTPSDAQVCEPRSYRDCTITYVDEDGQLQCPTQVQICSVDGTEWLACGMYVYDENHDPQPRP
jgi:hypothetical protein